MPWDRRTYRGNKVWILVDDAGSPELDDRGLARMRYKPEDERTYTVRADEVRPLPPPREAAAPGPPPPIEAWADAWTTPEATGIAVVLAWRGRTREIVRRGRSMPRPRAGIAAVVVGLEAIRRRSFPVRVHTPHVEAIHALRGSRRDAEPSRLADRLRAACRRFKDLRFVLADERSETPNGRRARALARRAAEGAR